MLYNPWQHAKALGMRIIERDFTDDNILGLYLGKGAIALNSSMTYQVRGVFQRARFHGLECTGRPGMSWTRVRPYRGAKTYHRR